MINATTHFIASALCLVPVLLSLDLVTPWCFSALALAFLALRAPRRLPAALGVALACAVAAYWVYLANAAWTTGPGAQGRAYALALRSWALSTVGASFGVAGNGYDFLDEAMQLGCLPARWGFAAYAGLAALPRAARERAGIDAVHRARFAGRRSPPLARAVATLALAIRGAERAAVSMSVRGLDSGAARTWLIPARFGRSDALALALSFAAAAGTWLWLILSGCFSFGY
jgi:energy-coupling factor transporter transmembrane protein EcfT